MRVFAAKAGEHHAPFIRVVIAVGVLEMQQVRLLAHVHAAVAADDRRAHVEPFKKHRALVGHAIVVGVLENDDAVLGDLRMIRAHGVQRIVLGFANLRHGVVLVVLRFRAKGLVLVGRAIGILVAFHHPQAAACIPGHGHGIDDHGLMRKAAHLIAIGHGHLLPRFLRSRAGGVGRSPGAFQFDGVGGVKDQDAGDEKTGETVHD